MARHTSLYQAPRSPLIQGRTRWERPLWQAWFVGTAVGAFVLLVVAGTRVGWDREMLFSLGEGGKVLMAAAAVAAGAAIGAGLGRLWGWRKRWLASSLVSIVFGLALWAVLAFNAVAAVPMPGR